MNLVALPSSQISVLQLPADAGAEGDEDIVMIHGLAANLGFWYAGMAPLLTRFGRVTLFDLLGHGHSDMPPSGYSPARMAEDFGHLLDRLDIERVHIVAHSFGGMVALSFALQQPKRVKSLILADVRVWQEEPASWQAVPSSWLERMRAGGLALEDQGMDPSFQVLVDMARLQLTAPETARTTLAAFPGGQGLFRGRRAAQRWLQLIETTGAYAEMTSGVDFALGDLARITQPILAVFGEQSLRKRSARALRRLCPDCTLQIVPKAGHFFPLTRPRIFARMALEFLETADQPHPPGGRRAAARRRRLRDRADMPATVPALVAAE